ncbi:T9SS type B sorting domain-containing protein [Polaribacter sp. MED152]|uniref:T9SS type B sorting domain-containing protein n=1 Tax=Polaribacter sp. MED152 TaxID=313598 RepID=UPI000068CA25|nr:T9SS type B sorting domain-containing protein [Polaribacter sp. MED152]EAQ42737.1 hypothetical protein MED152_08445 [Polaribacter sp. MED152]
MNTQQTLKKCIIALIVIISFANQTYSQTFVEFKQRLQNGGVNLKGDITFIANSIVSKNQDGTVPNDDYNGSQGNNKLNLDYIDIDNDPTTFSSSKAALNLPGCSKVVFAGLYWSAVYPRKYWNDVNSTRDVDVNTIKFKLPNQEYQDVTGDVIFDGPTISGTKEKIVYTCFKDITTIIDAQDSPNGDYVAANIKATVRGKSNTGSSAGWIMVVIYENELEPTRRVSIFDGFTAVKGGSNSVNAEVSYSGFKTIPNGPVRAKMLVAALEGDKSIKGDRFQMKDINGTFQTLSTPNTNPATNFFNGSITVNDQFLANRSPSSENTLGFDADIFNLNNVNNQLIANDQTDADIKLTTSGDGYWVFLNAMSVEIIEPDIELVKTIEDTNGNDISGGEVNLGNEIWYNIAFRNKGNDNATNTTIIDRLPKNVDLFETELIMPLGVTYTYQAPTIANEFRGELVFTIPDNLVELGDPTYNIRLKVKVVESCNELRDVCSNIIQNQAFVNFTGEINGVTTNNTPSYFGVDACNRGYEGPSNFLADVDQCTYEREEVLCTDTVDLTAGAGFLSYTWKNANGDVIGNTQTITVDKVGRYTVDKVAPVGCISSQEIINVVSFITQPNPVIDFADEVKVCSDDGSELSEIYLCGTESSKLIKTNIYNSNTILWQKLDEDSCIDDSSADCPNTSNSCTWNTVKTGNDYNANEPGKYRVEIRAQGGCFKRYYFDVFQATLDPLVDKTDLICGNIGNITINNIPANYQFSLTNDINTFQDSNSFDITAAGTYTVFIRKKGGSATSCVYELPAIDVFEKNIEVDLIVDQIHCSDSDGTIRVQVNNVDGEYVYQLFKGGQLLSETSPKIDNDHTFVVSEAGIYTVKVTAPNNCSFEGDVTITKPEPLALTAVTTKNISCTNGRIDLTTIGGTPIYNYAIWSIDGVELYANPTTIPIIEFFTDSYLEIAPGDEGVYQFVIVDGNNCFTFSNPTEVIAEPAFTFTESIQNVTCNGNQNGSFTITPDQDVNNYTLNYSINNGTNYQTENLFSNLNAGNYKVLIRATKALDTCNYTKDIVITEAAKITGNASITQNYTCNADATITFDSVSGGNTPYTYSIDGVNFFEETSFPNLKEGTYTPIIKDANDCTLALNDIIIDPLPTVPIFTTNLSYSCTGNATIEILPNTTGYLYSLDGNPFTNSNIFADVPEGNHTISINIGSECLEEVQVTVLPNQGFNSFVANSTDISCFGDANGSITIEASNYNSSFEYSLNGGSWVTANASPLTINNLDKGDYSLRVQSDSCTLDLGSVTISEPNELQVTASIAQEITCTNATAVLDVNAIGGNPPYQYSIDNGATWVDDFTSVVAGNYTIKARDSKGCETAIGASITVNPAKSLLIDTSVTSCFNGTNGEIKIDVTQGNDNYVFRLNNGPWQSPSTANPNTFTFTNLQPNTYTVEVKDGFSCEVLEQNIVLNNQLNASIVTADIGCNPGSINVTATGGDSNYVYAFISASATITNADFSANSSQNITTAGDYKVYVRDNNGATDYCEYLDTVTINKAADVDITASVIQPKCFDEKGNLTLDFSGGLAPYTINVSNTLGFTETSTNIYNTTKEYYNLDADTYTITITDANNCSKTISSLIENPVELTATINPILPTCGVTDLNQFGIEFITSNSYAPYTLEYSIDNGTTWSNNNTFMSISSGTVFTPVLRLLETDGVTVRCIKVLDNFRMPFHVSNLIVSSSATGDCKDGFQVTVEAQDGVAPYEFAVNSTSNWVSPTIVNGTTYVFENLTPGLGYYFYVKDATGCIKENSVDIYDSFTPEVEIAANVTQEACATSDTGELTFTINDPSNNLSGTLNWQLFDVDTNLPVRNGSQSNLNDIVVSNLPAGNFYLVITNNACSWGSRNARINRGAEINGSISVLRDITCNQPGIVNIDAISGGFGDYTFTLTSTNFINPIITQDRAVEIDVNNLVDATIASTINVAVSDEFSCLKDLGNVVINISEKPEIQNITSNLCTLNNSITINASKGLAPYFYSIDNGVTFQSDANFYDLAAGNYTAIVMDSNGCLSLPENVIIYPPLNFEATITKNLDCTLNADASVEINVLQGSNNYEYEVVNSASTSIISRTTLASATETIQLSDAGVYTITVFDLATNCSKSITVEVLSKEEPTFTFSVDNSTCSGTNSGTIALQNSNSSLDYTYSISPVSGSFDATTNSFINVAPGTYTITALGNNNCTIVEANVTVNEFDPIQIPTPTITDFSCTTGNTYNNASITIDTALIMGGSGNYTQIDFINNKGTATTTDDEIVQTGNNDTYILSDTNGGNFTIVVYDDEGCSASIQTNVNEFFALTDIFITEDVSADCKTGASISVTTNTEVNGANKSYTISNNTGFTETNTTGIFKDIAEGSYTIRVLNLDTNCYLETNYTIENVNEFDIIVQKNNDLSCANSATGSVSFQFSSTTIYSGNYDYVLFDKITNLPTTFVGSGSGETIINNLTEGEYYIKITQLDIPFCDVESAPFSIEGPAETLDFDFITTPITCVSANSGTLLIDAFGGWQEYEYQLATATGTIIQSFSTNNSIDNLAAENYIISVRDKFNCVVDKSFTLENPLEITADITVADLVCFDEKDGAITVSNVAGGQGNPVKYYYQIQKDSGILSVKQESNVFDNLTAGNYTVVISDEYSCSKTYNVVIDNPDAVLVTANITTGITCSSNLSEVTLSASGGSGNYTYSKDGISFTNSPIFEVAVGTHQFYAKDDNGCISEASAIVEIDALNPLTAILDTSAANVSCAAETGAVISAIASGGFGNYQYELLNDADVILRNRQDEDTFSGLSSGTYKIRVYSEDCVFTTESYTITEPVALEIQTPVVVSNISCFGNLDGSIVINATGGTGDLVYSIDQVKYESINVFNNLPAGIYNVTVQDESGCFVSETVEITEPDQLTSNAINVQQELCLGSKNAAFDLEITGGNPPYKTSLNGAAFVENQLSFSNLEGGKTYVIFIEDAKGCEDFLVVPLEEAVEVNLTTNTTLSCTNYLSTIEASVNASASSKVQYSINNGALQTSGIFSDLASGTYTVTALHENGCEVSEQIIINNPNPLTIEGVSTQDILCFGGNNGSIVVTSSGGQGVVSYSIDGINFQTDNTFTNLSKGTYQVTIKDELDCQVVSTAVVIDEVEELKVSLKDIQHATCFGESDAGFEIEIEGGTAPYNVKLDNGASVENQFIFSDLEGGKTYQITVVDANNCTTNFSVDIEAGVSLNLTTNTTLNCINYLSEIEATVNASEASKVQYSINNGALQTSGIFSDLATGSYTITAVHENGCEVSEQVIINNPNPLTIEEVTSENILCFGGNNGSIVVTSSGGQGVVSYSIDGTNFQTDNTFANLSPGTYQVTIKDELNCEVNSTEVTIDEIDELKVSVKDIQQATCVGESDGGFEIEIEGGTAPYNVKLDNGAFVENQFAYSNLEGGKTYQIIVVDANNCTTNFSVDLESSVNLDLVLSPEYTCNNNATVFALVDDLYEGDVTYTINGTNPQQEGIFIELVPGNYTITATHKNGCSTSETISIKENPELILEIDTSEINKLIANASGGVPPYTYSIDNGSFTPENTFIISETRIYNIAVKDSRGCVEYIAILGEFIDIEIPNFFTPNGNGKHDCWYPTKVKDYHNIEVLIYDRYSRLLKTFKGVNNCWDGLYNNKPLPSGDYWYVIYYDQKPGVRRRLMGNFTLYR